MVRTNFWGPDTPDNLSLQNQVNPRLIFTYPWTERVTTELIADFLRSDVQSPGADYYQYGGSGRLSYELTPSLSLVLGGAAHESVYDNAFLGKYLALEGETGFVFQFL